MSLEASWLTCDRDCRSRLCRRSHVTTSCTAPLRVNRSASAGTEVAAFDAMKSGLCDGRILLEVWVLDRPWRRFYEGFKQSLVCRVLVARLPIRFKGGRA